MRAGADASKPVNRGWASALVFQVTAVMTAADDQGDHGGDRGSGNRPPPSEGERHDHAGAQQCGRGGLEAEDEQRVVDVPANPVLQLCAGETTAQRVAGLVEANAGDRRPDAQRAPVTVHRQLADRGYVDLRSAAERRPQRQVGLERVRIASCTVPNSATATVAPARASSTIASRRSQRRACCHRHGLADTTAVARQDGRAERSNAYPRRPVLAARGPSAPRGRSPIHGDVTVWLAPRRGGFPMAGRVPTVGVCDVREVLIAFVAAIVELVIIAASGNQWVTNRVADNATGTALGNVLAHDAVGFPGASTRKPTGSESGPPNSSGSAPSSSCSSCLCSC